MHRKPSTANAVWYRQLGRGAAVTAMAGLLAACGAGSSKAAAPTATPIPPLAVVNGQPITPSEWATAVAATELLNQTTLSTSHAAKASQVQDLVQQVAVTQWALRQHLITTAQAQKDAQGFVQKTLASEMGGAQALKAQLAHYHLTENALEQFLTQEFILEQAFNHVAAGVKQPSVAQAQAYFQAHQQAYATPTEVEVRHILVKTQAQAESLLSQIQHGAKFSVLAKKYSLDTASAKNGGSLGWVPQGAASGFVPHFYEEMDKLKPGQYGIAHTRYGYHIIEVQAIKPGSVPKFSAVQSQVVQQLWQQDKATAFQSFANQLVKKAQVKVFYH